MTEYWVSNSKHWCELCKCWLNDTPESRAHHERGSGHKLAVQRKLRDMRMKAERDAKEESRTRDQLQKLNEAADNAYKNDVKRMAQDGPPLPPPSEPPPQFGAWKATPDSKYLYNEALKHYYDPATEFYYGGHLPAWTQSPDIPAGAQYSSMHGDKAAEKKIIRGVVPTNLRNLGGQTALPVSAAKAADAAKRARDPPNVLSEAEMAEQRRREAARQRVEQRTVAAQGILKS